MSEPVRLLVSILNFGQPANVLRQLQSLPGWLSDLGAQSDIASRIVIRNNDPRADIAALADRVRDLHAEFPDIPCNLVGFVPNVGFGGGHNANIALYPSDYVLILNDDIGFPSLGWLEEAIRMLAVDPRTACVGADENPRNINPHFGNGLLPGAFNLHGIQYAEASVLLFSRAAFDRLGGFSADYPWA
ncbi:MAG TPA: hypothetical protein VMB71_06065, partial [Acetobacteraceae bacterium]|nr:hypothetical protein [Acetobacteraceae bacterium]